MLSAATIDMLSSISPKRFRRYASFLEHIVVRVIISNISDIRYSIIILIIYPANNTTQLCFHKNPVLRLFFNNFNNHPLTLKNIIPIRHIQPSFVR